MDNKILLINDNDFGENEILKTIEIKECAISCITYDPDPKCKFVIVGTNTGATFFYESETGKLYRTYNDA